MHHWRIHRLRCLHRRRQDLTLTLSLMTPLHMLAIPLGFSSLIVVWFHPIIAVLLIPTAFALAWLGHLIEGNKPAFLSNPAHVLVAPVWMVKKIFRRQGTEKPA